jgi:hypothetical protein
MIHSILPPNHFPPFSIRARRCPGQDRIVRLEERVAGVDRDYGLPLVLLLLLRLHRKRHDRLFRGRVDRLEGWVGGKVIVLLF